MSAINSETFGQICEGVWKSRTSIFAGRGNCSGEVALLRAVYWRLCKVGGESGQVGDDCDAEHMLPAYQQLISRTIARHASPRFDAAPFLEELLRRYREEVEAAKK
jgi:hypothetical protein